MDKIVQMQRSERSTRGDLNPQVTWSSATRSWLGKYRLDGKRHPKRIPVDVVCHSHPEGPHGRCRGCEDKALQWLSSWLIRGGKSGAVPTERKTLRVIGEAWVELVSDPKAIIERRRLLDRYLNVHPIADIDAERELDVPSAVVWIAWLKELKSKKTGRPLAPMTVRNIVQMLRDLLVEARGRGWIRRPENPLKDPFINKIMGKPERLAGDEPIVLSKEQCSALLTDDRIPAPRRRRYILALSTGLRLGELLALRWSDLDLNEGIVRVTRQLSVNGFKLPKKGKVRWVPLSTRLIAELQKIEGDAESPVFPDADGKFKRNVTWSRQMQSDLKRCGLETTMTSQRGTDHVIDFHSTRRTFNTLLRQLGCPADTRDEMLGHGGRTVGDRHYLGRSAEAGRPWVEMLFNQAG